MRKLSAILLMILLSFGLKAQSSDTKYYRQPNLKQFEGTWHYADDTVNFTVHLRKEKVHVKRGTDDFYLDLIQGDYSSQKHGRLLYSPDGKTSTITSGGFEGDDKNPNKINFIFADLGRRGKRCNVIFELLGSNPDKATWALTNTEHIVINNEYYDPTFSVPEKMVLTRVK